VFRIPKTLADITASIGSVYLMTVLVLWVFQEHFIYHPTNRVVQQAEIDMESRYVDPWMSPDGEMIGIKKTIVNPKMNYLVFCGNSGEALDRTYIANLLTQGSAAGNVYIMDYPGYGRRSGSPGKKAIFAAVESAVTQLKQENSLPIIVVGESVGSGAATYAAHQVGSKLRAVLLITPYNTMAGVVRKTVPLLPLWLILREDYDNAASGGYVWGATGPDSYDCSGLVWAAAKDIGVYSGNRFTTSTFRSVASGWATETNSPAVGDIVVWPGKHMGIVAGSDRYYSARSTKKGIGYATLTGDNNYFGISPEYWRVNQQWVNRQA
jgi:pimeloyl-ACP methyl ester carboxylesterase